MNHLATEIEQYKNQIAVSLLPKESARTTEEMIIGLKEKGITLEDLHKQVTEGKDTRELDAYDHMQVEALKKFPNCVKEIETFFEMERARNKQLAKEIETLPPEAAAQINNVRNAQWRIFWDQIKELELHKHNEKVRLKRAEKLQRKGKNVGARSFEGPTYTLRRGNSGKTPNL